MRGEQKEIRGRLRRRLRFWGTLYPKPPGIYRFGPTAGGGWKPCNRAEDMSGVSCLNKASGISRCRSCRRHHRGARGPSPGCPILRDGEESISNPSPMLLAQSDKSQGASKLVGGTESPDISTAGEAVIALIFCFM